MDFNFSCFINFFHNDLYKEFEIDKNYFSKIMEFFNINENILVAVSGGADSLALILLLNEWKKFNNKKIKISAVTVDHMLRNESSNECKFTNNILSNFGIEHETICWNHEKINSKLEEVAREARYNLLSDYCKKNNFKIIMTAHHANDQIETFLMRLKRGSSLNGICGIPIIRNIENQKKIFENKNPENINENYEFKFENGIKIIRPLLYINPESLKLTLKKRFNILNFVNDPHNFDLKFERVKLRKFLNKEFSIIEKKNILQTIMFLSEENYYIEQNVMEKFQENFNKSKINFYEYNYEKEKISFEFDKFFDSNVNLNYRKLKNILEIISEKKKICSYSIVRKLYSKIISKNFIVATAHGCLIKKLKNMIIFVKENR